MKQKTSKMLSILLVLYMGLALLPGTAWAVEYPVTGGKIFLDPTTGTITGSDGYVTDMVIPSTITDIPVIAIGAEAFAYYGADGNNMISVTIPDSIITIGGGAFFGCSRLADVYYGGSESQWKRIDIKNGNDPLFNATIHYNSTGPAATTKREDWSEAFYSFTLGGEYRSAGQTYYSNGLYDGIRFGLHDLDGDGVPELIAFNNGINMAQMTNYVYAYRSGKVTYWGDIGFRGYGFAYASGSGYPGLYYCNGNVGHFMGYYYTIQNGRLKEELVLELEQRPGKDGTVDLVETQKTSDNTLYRLFSDDADSTGLAEMSMLTHDEIRAKGWDNFVAQSMAADNTLFTDVNIGNYFYRPVKWAVDRGIANGTGGKRFSPNENCTTAQILTFLYRSQGEPKLSVSNPFNDVKSSDYFYNTALWAYEKGLISGTSFGGDTPCTRASAVTYLWKLAGSPTASGTSFTDVPVGADYASAVAWAVKQGITSGTSATNFSPNTICSRAQIVTFLYRAYA